ncbi:MAG TPA: 3'-5' exonuclease [Candidatus Omnitrophota bacterium]|nr:3'-5' exonuclease [Candidatus Omnitrophota bacterium]
MTEGYNTVLARETEYVIFDVETTGLSPLEGDRILELAAARVKGGKIIETLESFVNPKREIPSQAQAVHKITPEMVAQAPTSAEFLPRFVDFVGGACLCGQNVKFDLDFVCYELSLAGYKLREETPALDTIKLAKYFLPHLSSYRLGGMAKALGFKVGTTHRALADVQLTVQVFNRLLMIAEEQGFSKLQDVLREFGVQKPSFKFTQHQDTLF